MTSIASESMLFAPDVVGTVPIANRIVMAPMTRNRAGAGNVPTAMMAQYYAQRASAGLIITEATQVSPQGVGYPNTPGIHTDAQEAGWRRVADAVHERGGRIALQLWHVGRVSHVSMQPGGAAPVAPSAIAVTGKIFTSDGLQSFSTPRALMIEEIPGIVQDFAHGARRAIAAGMDAVEVHGANGYLIDQFLRDGSNHRTDAYGGTLEGRLRFLREVVAAVANAVGADRLGVRLSPTSIANSMSDSDPVTTFRAAARVVGEAGVAWLHVIDPVLNGDAGQPPRVLPDLRAVYDGTLIVNGGYRRASAEAVLSRGEADAVSFGVPFIANPDLPARFAADAPLAPADRSAFYGGDARGYIDYPALDSPR